MHVLPAGTQRFTAGAQAPSAPSPQALLIEQGLTSPPTQCRLYGRQV